MKCPRIHVALPLAADTTLELPEAAAGHLRVLRIRAGAPLLLFNGDGMDYPAELLALERRSATVAVGEPRPNTTESALAVTLVQGVSKGDRMEIAIQKAVELGVARIIPVFTARSVVRLEGRRLDRKAEHWRGVVSSACEQCGRGRLPRLDAPLDLETLLAAPPAGRRLVLDPRAGDRLAAMERPGPEGVSLLVGPEGGLDEEELRAARDTGWSPLSLGPRILRTETAGIAALAVVQALWGDL